MSAQQPPYQRISREKTSKRGQIQLQVFLRSVAETSGANGVPEQKTSARRGKLRANRRALVRSKKFDGC